VPDDHSDVDSQTPLDAAQRRIIEHPGYREKQLYDGLARTVYAVLLPNRDELLGLLDRAASDPELAIELFQNMWRPAVRMRFEGQVVRALHNYVAAATTLVDHTRRILRGRSGPILEAFEARKGGVVAHPEVPFIHGLRNYVLHHSLPFIGHQVHVEPRPDVVATGEIRLSVGELASWSGWSPQARTFLASHGQDLALRPVIDKHAELVVDLNLWLVQQLSDANAAALNEVNRLVEERNAILGDVGIDEARRITAEVSERRTRPRPTTSSDSAPSNVPGTPGRDR
jgi:hypothetical protein